MAKKKNNNNRFREYDRQRDRYLDTLGRQIEQLFLEACQTAAQITGDPENISLSEDMLFSFDRYPRFKQRADRVFKTLQSKTYTMIVNGINFAWTLANNKDNELVRQVFGDNFGRLSEPQQTAYLNNNDKAREAFIRRKKDGLGLSERVWKYANQYKTEIELGLDCGIRDGIPADRMATELKQYLRNPGALFRRVRDEHGVLQLSKAAAAYHPGQGVYRSAFKNARRLAVTEGTIAYNTADFERWQQFDFVVGIEIRLSNNHPRPDICDDLKGKYPKDFKFTGWHPHCRCSVITILKTQQEMAKDTRQLLDGKETLPPSDSVNYVPNVPKGFTDWLTENEERAKRAYSIPYFIRDNHSYLPAGYLKLYGQRTPYKTFAEQEEARTFNREHNNFSKEIKRNIRDLNSVMPVIQGKIMSATEADGGKVNPHFNEGTQYRTNCATCVPAYVMRRRGFDVEANEWNKTKKTYTLYQNVFKIWKRPDGSDTGFTDAAHWSDMHGKGSGSFLNFVEANTKEKGIYLARLQWKNSKVGHATIIERQENGNLFFYDPQSGMENWLPKWEKSISKKWTWLMRIDDKIIDPSFASVFVSSK